MIKDAKTKLANCAACGIEIIQPRLPQGGGSPRKFCDGNCKQSFYSKIRKEKYGTTYKKEWREKRLKTGLCEMCTRPRAGHPTRCDVHAAIAKEQGLIHRRKLRSEAIAAYGGKCFCCGESNAEFLAIDHINGVSENAPRFKTTDQLIRWLRKRNFPREHFRLLCHNCNSSIGYYGYCPHNGRPELPTGRVPTHLRNYSRGSIEPH